MSHSLVSHTHGGFLLPPWSWLCNTDAEARRRYLPLPSNVLQIRRCVNSSSVYLWSAHQLEEWPFSHNIINRFPRNVRTPAVDLARSIAHFHGHFTLYIWTWAWKRTYATFLGVHTLYTWGPRSFLSNGHAKRPRWALVGTLMMDEMDGKSSHFWSEAEMQVKAGAMV